jgi:CBS-domain-containing membrane protein
MLRVQQLMTQNVQSCRPWDSLEEAARKMWDCDIGVVAVVDGDERVIGMLTDRDACMAALMTGRALSAIRASEAMSKGVFGVRPEEPIDDAEDVMREHQVRRVPVLDAAGHLVGILSQNDLVREAARQRERDLRHKELSAQAVTSTIASIGKSRAGQLEVAVRGGRAAAAE